MVRQLVGLKKNFKSIKNQEEEKSPVMKHLLNLNRCMKKIKFHKNVNNCKGLNKETVEMYKNSLLNWG